MCQSVTERIAHRISIFRLLPVQTHTRVSLMRVFKLGKAPTTPPSPAHQKKTLILSRKVDGLSHHKVMEMGNRRVGGWRKRPSFHGLPCTCARGRVWRNFLIYFLASVQGSSRFKFECDRRQNKLLMEIHAFGIIDFLSSGRLAAKLSPSRPQLTFELYKFDMNATINGQGRCSIWQPERGSVWNCLGLAFCLFQKFNLSLMSLP